MPKSQVTSNLLDEFIEKAKHLQKYMRGYRVVANGDESIHFERALVKLSEAQRELEKIKEVSTLY